MIKIFIISIITIICFSGCSDKKGQTIEYCLKNGYNGVVIRNNLLEPSIYCTDGEIINDKIKTSIGSLNLNGKDNTHQEYKLVYLKFQ